MDAWDHFIITMAREYNVTIDMAKAMFETPKK
jgi:hypothetical protein